MAFVPPDGPRPNVRQPPGLTSMVGPCTTFACLEDLPTNLLILLRPCRYPTRCSFCVHRGSEWLFCAARLRMPRPLLRCSVLPAGGDRNILCSPASQPGYLAFKVDHNESADLPSVSHHTTLHTAVPHPPSTVRGRAGTQASAVSKRQTCASAQQLPRALPRLVPTWKPSSPRATRSAWSAGGSSLLRTSSPPAASTPLASFRRGHRAAPKQADPF
eukprot:365091-Chlamydomonas_euryale.AAC.14